MADIISAIILLGVCVYLLFYIIPAYMAEKRGRSVMGWFFLSILITPIYTAFIIFCLGETDEKRKERIFQEEEWKILCWKLKANKENHEN